MVDEVIETAGRQLRLLRQSRGLTLAELAGHTGLSDGYLSSVERGTTSPSLSSLATIAAVLGSDMSVFFPTTTRGHVHVHRAAGEDHLRIAAGSNETYTILSARSVAPNFTGLIEDIGPAAEDTTYSFFGERFLVMLTGAIELQIDTTTYRLGAGQMIHYSAHPNHRLRVVSDHPAQILWVVTPALL
ncbi:transcriptional regulator, XRE family with cupin sensor [Jatrophihabitans endophyticus]|uniref:Transcriptional regulator, XRE family with cupin sensor n=1 Tax=Jatrophihabitans endophyticus TaxID=1206085 RepID=A0A1M5PGS9_9ACTN|nr:XRE family transcriptional regulator [Jatrophihabitans endophyticus]SHH01014.1 transcriptional regulator, XRE family with cupin sensor [Jatrophihabitans endophyticus]